MTVNTSAVVSMNVNANTSPAVEQPSFAGAISIWLYPDSNRDVKASVLLTDPSGRRVGADARTGAEYSDIPGSGSERSSLGNAETGIPDPLHFELSTFGDYGDYLLEIIPAARETCSLYLSGHHPDRRPDEVKVEHIRLGQRIKRYRVHYTQAGTSLAALPDGR